LYPHLAGLGELLRSRGDGRKGVGINEEKKKRKEIKRNKEREK